MEAQNDIHYGNYSILKRKNLQNLVCKMKENTYFIRIVVSIALKWLVEPLREILWRVENIR